MTKSGVLSMFDNLLRLHFSSAETKLGKLVCLEQGELWSVNRGYYDFIAEVGRFRFFDTVS